MADDWIKMRHNLRDDPAVIAIASAICPENVPSSADIDCTVGRLHKIWSWFDQQTRDGIAHGISAKWIDFYVGCPGFSTALESQGWLLIRSKSVEMPGFDSHNGASAKKRASDAKRKRTSRNCPENVRESADKKRTRGEERRVEESNKKTPPTPSRTFTPPTLDEVKAYCLERGNRVDPETFRDFYEAKGWKVGAQPMKDWKAAVRTWEKSENTRGGRGGGNRLTFAGLEGDFHDGGL